MSRSDQPTSADTPPVDGPPSGWVVAASRWLYRLLITVSTGVVAARPDATPLDRVDAYLEARLDDPTYKLLHPMGLPLVDGAYPSLVMAGTLATSEGMLITGATVLGGSWMLTVILHEMAADSVLTRWRRIGVVTSLVLPVVVLETVLAPTLVSLIDMDVFRWFSVAVIVVVGMYLTNDVFAPLVERVRLIVVTGLLASLGARLLAGGPIDVAFVADPLLAGRAVLTLGVSVTLALTAAAVGPTLEDWLDMQVFSVGAGLSLVLVGAGLAGLVPRTQSLAVFLLAIALSINLDVTALRDRLAG